MNGATATDANSVRGWTHPPQSALGGTARFWLHAIALFGFYLAMVFAWGQRNSWPDDLVLCVLLMPMGILIASTLYVVYEFGLTIDPYVGQQEQLIAALILAVGLASGQLLLLTLGIVALTTAWLRPSRPGVDWTEWLKVPLVLLTTLPFWLDFQGSQAGWLSVFDDPSGNPVYQLPLALTTTQTRVLGYCGLLALVLLLHGRIFWMAVPVLPAFLCFVVALPRMWPRWMDQPPIIRQAAPWLLGVFLLMTVSWLARHIDQASRRLISGETLCRWFEERRYPPWVAILVVGVAQTQPFETARLGTVEWMGFGGILVLVSLLWILRRRTVKGPIHSRSVAMVAGALVLTLLAEFTTNDSLRRLATGFALIGLLSWHCFWPLRVFISAGLASIVLLGVPDDALRTMLNSHGLLPVRVMISVLLLVILAGLVRRPLPMPGASGYEESGWVPPKRFALILLGLMLLFQMASVFWPDHQLTETGEVTTARPDDEPAELAAMQTTGQAATYRLTDATGIVRVSVATFQKNPYLIESPEARLRANHWRVLQRVRIEHPRGEATALQLEKEGQRATALWWFEQGRRAFSNHLYARRVLWSGWHLADRDLRQVRLESLTIKDPRALAEFAANHQWFSNIGDRDGTGL